MRVKRLTITSKDKKQSTVFVVGRTLPEKLPKATREYFNTAVTPQLAYDIVARVKAIEEKLKDLL